MDWNRITRLTGTRLPLIRKPAFFTIDSSDADYLFITPEETGNQRRLYRVSFEQAEAAGLFRSNVRPSELSDAGVTGRNASYIAAIIRHVSA